MNRGWMHIAIFAGLIATGAAQSRNFAATAKARWRTFHSRDYGFAIEYPNDFPVSSSCMFEPIACFEYNGNALNATVITGLRLTVDILRDRQTEAECDDIDEEPTTTVVIHGTQFHFAQTWRGGMSKSESIEDYRVFHENVCLEIALVTGRIDVGPAEYGDLGIHPFDKNVLRAVQKNMDQMLRSFAFVGPVKK
jgi:hypothetical protein